ncbi:MAG: sigma-70 family RNA polymerase sigma factor [Nanoarchaeota archaeon]
MEFEKKNKKESIESLLSIYAETHDLCVRDKIIENYYPTIEQISGRISKSRPYKNFFLGKDDITSLVSMGFLNALEHYNLNKKVDFPTYAQKRIIGSFLDEERTLYHLKRTKEGISGVKKRPIFMIMDFSENDFYIPPIKTTPLDNLLHKEYRELLRSTIGKTFALYYLDGLTLKEIGNTLRITKSAVCKIIKKDTPIVKEKLKKFMKQYNGLEIKEYPKKKRNYNHSMGS